MQHGFRCKQCQRVRPTRKQQTARRWNGSTAERLNSGTAQQQNGSTCGNRLTNPPFRSRTYSEQVVPRRTPRRQIARARHRAIRERHVREVAAAEPVVEDVPFLDGRRAAELQPRRDSTIVATKLPKARKRLCFGRRGFSYATRPGCSAREQRDSPAAKRVGILARVDLDGERGPAKRIRRRRTQDDVEDRTARRLVSRLNDFRSHDAVQREHRHDERRREHQ